MADNKKSWNNNDDPFDGDFDPRVFGDDLDSINFDDDDDFADYFDKDIVESEMEKRENLFKTDEDNFGRDGFIQTFSSDDGVKTEFSGTREDLEKTRMMQPGKIKSEKNQDDLESTKKLDIKETLSEKLQKYKNSLSFKKKDGDGGDNDMGKNKNVKQKRKLTKPLYALCVVCAASILAAVAWIMSMDVLGLTTKDEEVTVTIPRDFTMGEVADILSDNDVIEFKLLFRIVAAISNADEKISAGTYVLNKNYDYRAIINGMTQSGGKMVEVEVTIPEGYNMTQVFELLEENSVCFAEDLWDTAANYDFDYDFLDDSTLGDQRRLEGYLFPDTYKFYMNDNPENVLDKMLSNFDNKITDEYKEKAESMGYTLDEIIIVASIIEEEAAGEADRAEIASVIYNRLKNTSSQTMGYLQLDSTINYIIYGTDQEFSTEIDSPYNTYTNKGLPAGPISNPGLAAIEAALNPASTSYYYFAIDTDGVTQFFKSYDSFMDFVNSSSYGG